MAGSLLYHDWAGRNGRSVSLSFPRRFIGDLLHFAKQVPTVPVQRLMNVAALRDVHARLSPKPSWCAVFTKAYALVAADTPALRRAFLDFPLPRLYEHPYSIASVAVETSYRGEPMVFFTRQHAPDRQPLAALTAHLAECKRSTVEGFEMYGLVRFVTALPRPIRRTLWWVSLNWWGGRRARRIGTFGVSVYSGLGVESLHPLSPATTTLNYGVIRPDGGVTVRVIYDHRVMDGATVGRALAALEEKLHGPVLDELRRMLAGQGA